MPHHALLTAIAIALLANCSTVTGSVDQYINTEVQKRVDAELERQVSIRVIAVFEESEYWGGVTICGTKPRTWLPDDEPKSLLDTQWLPGYRVHESVHRDIAREFPNCATYAAWNANPINRLHNEAAAFCFQAMADLALNLWPSADSAFAFYGQRLVEKPYTDFWTFELTASSAATLISMQCKPLSQ